MEEIFDCVEEQQRVSFRDKYAYLYVDHAKFQTIQRSDKIG